MAEMGWTYFVYLLIRLPLIEYAVNLEEKVSQTDQHTHNEAALQITRIQVTSARYLSGVYARHSP